MMKVNIAINSEVGIAGYGLRALPIIRECSKRGHEIDVYCRDYVKKIKNCRFIKPIPFAEKIILIPGGIEVYISPKIGIKFYNFFRCLFDWRVSRKLKKADIFHCWEYSLKSFKKAKEKGMITILDVGILRGAGAKKIFYGITDYFDDKFLKKNELEVRKYVDYYLVPSKIVKKTLMATEIPEEKIIINPFGVDIKKFYPSLKKRKNNKLKILFVGVIRKRKQVPLLMEAIKQLNIKDIELILCGRIHITEKKNIEKYKKKIKMKTIGFISHDKLRNVYNNADIFVFPSITEGSAKVTYEAMACGLPVITTETAGSVVREGIDGFIVPIIDIEALKKKILYFYNNPKEIKRMGKNARKRIEEFTWENYGKRVVDIYERVLK